MANLSLSFRNKGGMFALCATVSKTTTRHYKKVEGLVSPNFDSWDSKKQIFNEPTENAIHNNKVLQEIKEHYQQLIDKFDPSTGKELFAIDETKDVPPNQKEDKPITFGEFVLSLINAGKNEKIKNPSKAYQGQINLYHKLEREGVIINKPLSDICNKDFIDFGQFILYKLTKEEGQGNFLNIMKLFKAAHAVAVSRELNDHVLRYTYRKDAPIKKSEEKFAFTESQYNAFVNFDLEQIPQSGPNRMFFKELYRDFCIFLYEMKMRPVDVLRLHKSNIVGNVVTYTPEKKKNYLEERRRITTRQLTPTAKKIVAKYKGQSLKGYIFPFSMNNYDWDYTDADSWNKWHNRKQKQLQDINTFLHKFEKPLHIKGTITIYSFRHAAFTHAINSKDCNLLKIAKEGATSVKMLEQHYYHQQF